MESLIFVTLVMSFLLVFGILHLWKKWTVVSAPGELCIIKGSGRGDGRDYRIVRGGYGFRIPSFETVERLDMTLVQVAVAAEDVECAGGQSMTITCDVFANLSRRKPWVDAAVERFPGCDRSELERCIEETTVRCIADVVSECRPEDIYGGRERFQMTLSDTIIDELEPMGFVVQAVHLQRLVGEHEERPQSPPVKKEAAAQTNPW